MYSPEDKAAIYATICEQVSRGFPLRKICENSKSSKFPSLSTVMKWLSEDAAFSEQYARAREEQADYLADQIVGIADEPVTEFSIEDDEDGTKASVASRLEMERRKQRIDARKWVAAKLKPTTYGDKLDLSGDIHLKLPDEQVESRLAHLLRKAGVAGLIGGTREAEGEAEVLRDVPGDRASQA